MKEDMFTLLITAKSKMRKLLIIEISTPEVYLKKHWYKKPKLIHFHREDTNNKKRTP